MLDSKLNFHEHALYLRGKTSSKIKLLGWLKYTLDRNTLLVLYKCLILPIFDYADFIYHRFTKNDEEVLQRLQNAACHAILCTDMYAHISDMHNELNLSTLYQQRCQHISNQTHTFVNKIGPPECINQIFRVSEMHGQHTGSVADNLLHVPQPRLKIGENDFFSMIQRPGTESQVNSDWQRNTYPLKNK